MWVWLVQLEKNIIQLKNESIRNVMKFQAKEMFI